MSSNAGYDDEEIKKYMTKCLWDVKNGNAFTLGDLDETAYPAIVEVDDDMLLEKFFQFVAKSMVGAGKKKKAKKLVNHLLSHIDTWKDHIIATDAVGEDATMDGMDEEDEEQPAARKKKSAKKRKSSSSKSKPAKRARVEHVEDDELPEDTGTPLYTREQIEAERARFESEKAEMLDTLSDQYKSRFGEICFVKWKNNPPRPVLLCSPYSVPFASQARNQWMHMYDKTKSRPASRTFLVYWYGSSEGDCYTFQPRKSLIKWAEAKGKGILKPPSRLLEKNKLTAMEKEVLKAYEDYEADLEIPQEERKPPFDIMEEHEVMAAENGGSSDVAEEEMIVEEDAESLVSDEDDAMVEEDEPPKKKKGKKKSKKIPPESQPKKAKKKSKSKKEAPPEVAKPSVDDEDDGMEFAEDDISEDEEKDEFEEPPSEEEDDEDLDGTYEVENSKPKTKKKTPSKNGDKPKTKKRKKSTPDPDDDESDREKPAKKPKAKKAKPKVDPKKLKMKQALKREQKLFDECKSKFGELHGQWMSAIKSKHAKKLVKILQEVERQAKHMSAPYIEKYVAPFLRQSKPLLLQEDKAVEKSARNVVKTVHGGKKPKVPDGFVPQDDSDDAGPPETSDQTKQKPAVTPVEKPALPENADVSKIPESKADSNGHAVPAPAKLPAPEKVKRPVATPESPRKTAPPELRQVKSAEPRIVEKVKLKKSFSLGGLMKTPRNGAASPKRSLSRQASSNTLDTQAATTAATTSWLKEIEAGVAESLEDASRKLAVEFLVEAGANYLPSEKVNATTFARNLEHAIHVWSSDPKRRSGAYWDRVHTVVGAICGNEDLGRIGKALLKGKYKSAKQLASLAEEELLGSFY